MKRIIAFVISFTLSFLFFFSSTAMAEEVQVAIPEVTSQLPNPGFIIQVPPVKLKNTTCPVLKAQANTQVWKEIFSRKKELPSPYTCSLGVPECTTNGRQGYCLEDTCMPC